MYVTELVSISDMMNIAPLTIIIAASAAAKLHQNTIVEYFFSK